MNRRAARATRSLRMSQASSTDPHVITDLDALAQLYGTPSERAITKELDYISGPYQALIEHSPFLVIASVGPEGMDCSPRGDAPGFVKVQDRNTVLLPDRRGNNRIDTLRNIVRDPRMSLLFLIPGAGETLRINGRGTISTDPELCASFVMQGKAPTSVLLVQIDTVYFQCKKALVRSNLWNIDAASRPKNLPTAGEMIQATSKEPFDGAAYDKDYPERMKKTIY